MKICVLGSGSRGNATLVEAGSTRILVDAGFSGRDLERRLREIDVAPESLDAVLVTHDHTDHTRGMGIFARRFGSAIYITEPTERRCAALLRGDERVVHYRAGFPFDIGSLRVEPFLTVHDAVDPVGVAVVDPDCGTKVGVATDLGRPTSQVRHALSSCDAMILEANHDDVLLAGAPYPWSVKHRISSSHGHLSNEESALFATQLLHDRMTCVILAHLSAEANRPELARDVVGSALEEAGYEGELRVARQEAPGDFMDLEELRRRAGPSQLSLL